MVTEILSKVDVIYKSSDHMTSSDAQEAARLSSIEDQGGEDGGLIVDIDEYEDEPTEEDAGIFMTSKIPVILVRLLSMLSGICVPSTTLKNLLV